MVDGDEVPVLIVRVLSSLSCSKVSSVSFIPVRLCSGGGEVAGSSEISIRNLSTARLLAPQSPGVAGSLLRAAATGPDVLRSQGTAGHLEAGAWRGRRPVEVEAVSSV